MNFLVDAQLPPALCALLNAQGHTVWHVVDIGCQKAVDRVIWDEADKRQATVVTKDEDFASRAAMKTEGPAVVWVRVGNCSNDALLKWFEHLLPEIVTRLASGERLIEVR